MDHSPSDNVTRIWESDLTAEDRTLVCEILTSTKNQKG